VLQSQQKVPEIKYNSLYQNKTVLPIKQFNSPYIVAGVFTIINEEDIFPLLTDVLFILAGFAVLTGAFLIISLFSGREPRTADEGSTGKKPYRKPPSYGENIIQSPPPDITEGFTDLSEENPGLFNPRTGLSHGKYLEKRLSSELERSAANEQDLTLLLIQITQMEYDDEVKVEAKNLTDFFTFEDMIFEYSENIFAVILPNTNLDEAIEMTERYQEKTSGAGEPKRSFGLSSRNGRLIDGERLIVESTLALKKADDRNPIVGFRPDPNKYRDYLSSKRQKGKVTK
jgi:GGDEF domain-containing protein